MKLKEIVNLIIEAEERNDVYSIKYKNRYPIWPFYRMYFYHKYLIYKGVNEKSKTIYSRTFYENIKKFSSLLIQSKLSHLIFNRSKYKYLIISTQRYINDQEIYTKELKEIIGKDYIEFSLSEKFDFHNGPIYLDIFKVLFKIISFIFSGFTKTPIPIKIFFQDLGVPSIFDKDYQRYNIEYKLWFILFNFILKKFKPKKIFFVSGVYFTPLIAAAEENNILIYELQHGVINKFHLAYHFPYQNRIGFFSNGLLLLSDFWKKMAIFPEGTELINIGNSFFYKHRTYKKKLKLIVFIGQPNISFQLVKYITENIEFFIKNEYDLIYKLHPQEYVNWQESLHELVLLNNNKNINVISNEQSVNQILNEAGIVFGVSSTVIYEAVDSGCKTFVLDFAGSEYFDDLIEMNIVKKINPLTKLTIQDLDFSNKQTNKFFDKTNFKSLSQIAKV